MLLREIMSLPTSYAIFTGKFAGVRALERHECGAFERFAAIGDQFSADFSRGEAIFFDRCIAPPKAPHSPPSSSSTPGIWRTGAGHVIDDHVEPSIYFRATHEALLLIPNMLSGYA